MKSLFVLLSACLLSLEVAAQAGTCTQGCASTTVLLFDFAVNADTAAMSPAAKQRLFYIAPALRKRLTSRPSCLEFLDGNEVKQPEDIFSGGGTPNVNVQESGAYHLGEHLITGTITGTGPSFAVAVNVETSVSRKIIKRIQVAVDGNNWAAAAETIDAALGSLENCIKDYETRERATNMKVAFGPPFTRGADAKQLLEVKPKKSRLQMGEETEVEITLKDCDGYPLKNRTVSFTGEMYDSLWRSGTYGGTVTPSKVITDDQGKAIVKFKAGKQYSYAGIVAHYCFEQPCGRKDVISGSAPIDMQLKPYRVIACYTATLKTTVDFHSNTSEYTESRNSNSLSKVQYMVEFYYAPTEFENGLTVNSIDTSAAKIYVAQEKGNSLDFASGYYLKRFHSGETIYNTTLLNGSGGLVESERAMVSADTSGLHLFSFALNLYKTGKLNGKAMEPLVYPAAQLTGYEGDGHTTFKTLVDKDPTSPYKSSSIFTYTNQVTNTDNGTTTTIDEYFMIRIFKEK
jgi:hypothetical protein